MKNKILVFLLILSLGFNIGVILTFGHHRFMMKEFNKWPKESSWHKDKLKKLLNLTPEQVVFMEKDRKDLQDKITPIKEELKNKRGELFALIDSDIVDSIRVDKLIEDIARLQMNIEKTVITHSVSVRKTLRPEQQKKFKDFMKKGFRKMGGGPGMMTPGHEHDKHF